MKPDHAIVLFDDVCHLCTSTVQWIIKRDPHGYFTFAALQSAMGRTLVEEHGLQPDALDTFVVVEGSRCFTRSDAALRVAQHLAGGWALLRILSLLPKPVRDWGYTVIAQNRYRWFGTHETCMVPHETSWTDSSNNMPVKQAMQDRISAMPIRPVQPTDHTEWLRMRLNLWGGAAEEHTQDIATYFATPQSGVTFVVESTGGGLCGFIEVSLRDHAEGCQTSPVAYIEGWYVDAESRRHRVGTRLVQAAEAWARHQGLKEIASDIQIDNIVSIQAHKVLGYEEVERLVCFRNALDASNALQDVPSDASASTRPQRAGAGHAPQA